MTRALIHRGPDDEGLWNDGDAQIALGHRRLSIVDLSPAGHEPMHSSSGRWVVTYNGEIYNHEQLRRALEERGQAPERGWRGHSDIETVLEAIDHWGLDQALEQAVGMFAFALWDRKERRLHLVRDRFGEKPLYWGWVGKDFVFASELKAIRMHPGFDNPIDRQALADYAARLCIPAPRSIYRGLFKLPPGCWLTIDLAGAAERVESAPSIGSGDWGGRIERWYDYVDIVRQGLETPFSDRIEALDAVEDALARSVAGQRMADVPVGVFLSGGIDSSLITATYQSLSSQPIRSFSIGVEHPVLNEADDARRIATHLGTIHRELMVTAREAQDVIPLLPTMYDEPFADSSQIPTYLVSRFAREEVTVALSGDGGDEFFGGYNRHRRIPAMWGAMQRVPRPLRAAGGGALSLVGADFWQSLGRLAGQRSPDFGGKVQRAWQLTAGSRNLDDLVDAFRNEWSLDQSPVLGAEGPHVDPVPLNPSAPAATRIMAHDALHYLPDDILAKVDRASMAVSLETRAPFLDHRLAAVAARIPVGMNISGGQGKAILRQLVARHIPGRLMDRPKSGFAVPIGDWLRGPLRDWAETLLSPDSLKQAGLFDPRSVEARWARVKAGSEAPVQSIWAVLMAQAWRN